MIGLFLCWWWGFILSKSHLDERSACDWLCLAVLIAYIFSVWFNQLPGFQSAFVSHMAVCANSAFELDTNIH